MSGAILKSSKMPRGMWVYVGSRGAPRPVPGSINQGLRALEWHVGIGQATSANVRQHRTWPALIALRLHTTVSRRRPWPARIGRGLRNIGRGVVDNMRMSMHSQNQKSVKHPSCITIYSSIFHHPFSTFPPHVVRSP